MSRVEEVKRRYVSGAISDTELDDALEEAVAVDYTCDSCGERNWQPVSICEKCRSKAETHTVMRDGGPVFLGQSMIR